MEDERQPRPAGCAEYLPGQWFAGDAGPRQPLTGTRLRWATAAAGDFPS